MTEAEIDALLSRLDADATMNLELPVVSHLQTTGGLEREAAALIRELRKQDRRAWYAGLAMQGLLANGRDHPDVVAKIAREKADALIDELEKEKAK